MQQIKDVIRSIFTTGDNPRRIAFAVLIGVFLGFSPLNGLHTMLALFVAVVFRLNKVAVLCGVFLNTPWIVVLFYNFSTWFGIQLIGVPSGMVLPNIGLNDFLNSEFWSYFLSQRRLPIPAFLGSFVLHTILSLASYFLTLSLLRKHVPWKLETP